MHGEARALDRGWRAAVADEALRRDYPAPEFDDGDWQAITVPAHWRSHDAFADSDGPLLYRSSFETGGGNAAGTGSPSRRSWLVVDGAMYTSDVWLDGAYLGDTEGYFFPHTFEITEQLRERPDHVLAMEIACPPPGDLAHKRNLTGVFQHWDLIDLSWNPGGLWCPPRIEHSGPVRIRHFRVVCRQADESSATIFLRAVLDAAEPCAVTFDTWLDRPDGEPAVVHRDEQPLAAGENRVEWTITEPNPLLWWPWSLGEQPLYDLTCEVRLDDGLVSDSRRRRLGLRSISAHNFVFTINGERLFLKGANHGPTRAALAETPADEVRRDVTLAKEAGLDFLRVHAHVARPELYDAADEQGLLLWQDLPLQWGYARSVRREARRQAREAADLLAHHPSIFVWCGHNEPLAVAVTPAAIDDPGARWELARKAATLMMLPTWNKTVLDRSIKRVLEKCDGSRPVIAHSGVLPHPPQLEGTDTHTYFGWYHGQFRQFPRFLGAWPRVARFVSEFGAQAVPRHAPWLQPERWPDLDWHAAHERHALQKVFFDQHVPPAGYETFGAWVDATQRYQADLLKCHIESLRRIAYRPCGGFALFCLADCTPAVTWSVLDIDREPKLAYDAVRAACAPVIVVADWLPETMAPGEEAAVDLHVVNATRIDLRDMVAKAHLSWRETGETARTDAAPHAPPPRRGEHHWRFAGDAPTDSVVRVGTIGFVTPDHPAEIVLDLELSGAGPADAQPCTNRYTSQVAARA
ncbi:MAG: hypothetical protein HYX32_03975 [Actinobacteria bacterium]|nr:hypothetical protein [Actinomycetota bacterium]